jgi:phage regulator Rha-like protein
VTLEKLSNSKQTNMPKSSLPIPAVSEETIVEKIYIIRGQKVMLDRDLAEMYGVEVRVLNQAVKRNSIRFPEDFMFRLTKEEDDSLRSQFVILKRGKHSKYFPFAFTEQGVAMLSSVLNSETAIQVNIQIIRLFTKMKQLILDNKDLWMKIEKIEQHLLKNDEEIKTIFAYLKKLLIQENKPRNPIGFKVPGKTK